MLARIENYSIWSDTAISVEGNTIINIQITDGEICWETVLEEKNLPPSRKNQNWAENVPLFLSILRRETINDYELQLDVPSTDLALTITENIKGTSLRSLVLKLALPRMDDIKASINRILFRSSETIIKYRNDAKRVQETETEYVNTINQLGNDLNEIVDYKEKLQTEMLRAMCVLLNSKSSEIRLLRSRLLESEQGKSNDTNGSTEQAESAPSSSAKKVSDVPAVPQAKKVKVPAVKTGTKSKSVTTVPIPVPICSIEIEPTLECEIAAVAEAPTAALIETEITVTAKREIKKHRKRKLGDSSDDSDADEVTSIAKKPAIR